MSDTSRISSPFDTSTWKTERSAAAVLMHWMREIIESRNLGLGAPDVETSGSDRKMPDLVIYRSPRSSEIACVIEAKPPYFDVFHEEELKEPARAKATKRRAPYFALTNFKEFVWYKTESVNTLAPEEDQIAQRYSLSDVEDLSKIEQTRYKDPTKRELERFLTHLHDVLTGQVSEPKLPVDDLLVFRLQQKIHVLARRYRDIIEDKAHRDNEFMKDLMRWFAEQEWNFSGSETDFDKAARQTAYLLINKIVFYEALQAKRPDVLDPLEIPQSLTKGSRLKATLDGYFKDVLNIDYETIYTTDFIDSLAFPDEPEVVRAVKELANVLTKRYNFSTLSYDVIGRIFERLIPDQERHSLGQYFTSADIVDFILRFCLKHENDKVLDPACGAGTFLVRAYQHKSIMNQRLDHETLLSGLWGNDVAKFPAHLATINLAIKGLGSDRNYPNILQEDFFRLHVGNEGFEAKAWRKRRANTLGIDEREVEYPRVFDAIVGNPPYTRQEEIPDIGVDKSSLIASATKMGRNSIANISRRAAIYVYFFIHATKFLKNGGRFGFIVSNSWLDVEYGAGLQEFLLTNYRVSALIESKVERWFDQAGVNTCIVLLEKCDDEAIRNANQIRFVYLKKPIRHFIPPASEIWQGQVDRLRAIDELTHTFLAHDSLYENDDLRVYPKNQKELRDEGYDAERNTYVGSKWGKYLRAPDVFFTVADRAKASLVPLETVAREIKRGFTTGANDFFYLTEEEIHRAGIERRFWMHKNERGEWTPNYLVKSPRECESLTVNVENLKYRVVMIHDEREALRGTKILKHIKWGEDRGFPERPTCRSRQRWYDLGAWEKPDFIWADAYNDRYAVFATPNALADKRFFYIYVPDPTYRSLLFGYLNCSLIPLFIDVDGITNLGEGAIYTNVYQLKRLPVPSPESKADGLSEAMDRLSKRPVLSIFEELGTRNPQEVTFETVREDRRELDRIIMGDILHLTESEQLDVYRSVIDIVRSRLDRASSVNTTDKRRDIDVNAAADSILTRLKEESEK